MEDKILELLTSIEKSFDFEEIMNEFNLNNPNEIRELSKVLNKLEKEGKVYRTKNDKFMLFKYCHLKNGKLEVNKKGFGFVITDEGDIYIDERNMNGAVNGDIVNVEIIRNNNEKHLEGKIVKIVSRDLGNLVGEFYYRRGKGYVSLDDPKMRIQIEMDKKECKGLVNGHKVLIQIAGHIKDNRYKGKLIKVIGHRDDPGIDIIAVAYKHNIDVEFSKNALEELKDIPSEVIMTEIKGRKDLRNEVIFTIDGDDTKDIDDAISIEKLENGNYKLGVHIADVTNYVKEGSKLKEDALDRGTSVYLANTVIPMLPHYLSNGICSLNPDCDRLAISCVMEIDGSGNIKDYDIFESVIKSRIQMTYKNVNKILEENIIPEGYEPFVDTLKEMKECSKILRTSKIKRGYIDFDQDEPKVITDDTGKPIDIKLRERGTGENMIEDFMIAANETVASHIYYMNYPFVYRVHEYPKEEKIDEFLRFVSALGYKLTGKRKDLHPKRIQEILLELKDKKEYKILSKMLLRTMRKAYYSKENLGHYGLASKCYTHFTSPIRRFPDLTVHTILKKVLHGEMDKGEIQHWEENLLYITEHSSEKERSSVEAEREVDDMKMAEYMEGHIGEEYTGMISSITNFGMFIELDNLVEGLVHINTLNDDFYHYDDYMNMLKGERTNKIYKLGDIVKIKVIGASKKERTVDFEIVKNGVEKDEKSS